MTHRSPLRGGVVLVAVLAGLAMLAPTATAAGKRAEAKNLKLLGADELQGRSAYQPTIHLHQRTHRWIAYVGHHAGTGFNPLTREEETNGTSIVDVTNPKRPKYLFHIPGPAGSGEAGGAQMARVCDGSVLPGPGDDDKVYLLRTRGTEAHEVWDVTRPARPELVTTIVDGLVDTHKNFWECETGIAFLASGVPGWRAERMTQIFDLSVPANPIHIRDYGLVGQEPGSTGPIPTDLHGAISLGNRVYFGHGTAANGIMQIADREKLLTGPAPPTPANLLFPQVSLLKLSSLGGAHTTFPVLGVPVREHGDFPVGGLRNLVVIVNEATGNECTRGAPQMVYIADITDETTPQVISNYQVRESEGEYCQRGGRFGAHASNENMTDVYYRKVVFVSWFNAGVRAVDIRDPFDPQEVGKYIPAVNRNTFPNCIEVNGVERCKTAVQTNNVEVDERGYVYLADRAGTGMHILKATGKLAAISGQ